jgi:hypothetical protein
MSAIFSLNSACADIVVGTGGFALSNLKTKTDKSTIGRTFFLLDILYLVRLFRNEIEPFQIN